MWPKRNSPSISPNRAGWNTNANEIWTTQLGVALSAMNQIGATAADIAAIGITNQRETTIVWDRNTPESPFTGPSCGSAAAPANSATV